MATAVRKVKTAFASKEAFKKALLAPDAPPEGVSRIQTILPFPFACGRIAETDIAPAFVCLCTCRSGTKDTPIILTPEILCMHTI